MIYQCDIFILILDIAQRGTVSFPHLKGCIIVNITFVLQIVLISAHFVITSTLLHLSSHQKSHCLNIFLNSQAYSIVTTSISRCKQCDT